MKEIKKGCVLRHRRCSDIKIWIVAQTFSEDKFIGVALSQNPLCCDVGDTYSDVNLDNWELTDEFYDVAEVVTKMQKGEE